VEEPVSNQTKFRGAIFVVVCLAAWQTISNASAITAEVAKKCDKLTQKAFPPREIGNPAAGSIKGTPRSIQDYFSKCVANGGNMDSDAQDKK
jgi:hypothetical protein